MCCHLSDTESVDVYVFAIGWDTTLKSAWWMSSWWYTHYCPQTASKKILKVNITKIETIRQNERLQCKWDQKRIEWNKKILFNQAALMFRLSMWTSLIQGSDYWHFHWLHIEALTTSARRDMSLFLCGFSLVTPASSHSKRKKNTLHVK